jgi:phage shock protein A
MDQVFRDLFTALQATNEALAATLVANRQTIDAAIAAHDEREAARSEHEDLRETVARLEALVIELVRRLNGAS